MAVALNDEGHAESPPIERALDAYLSLHVRILDLFRSELLKWPKYENAVFVLISKPFSQEAMVLPDRIELSTSPLPMECSTLISGWWY
jgi:hypothetical protein